MFGFWQEPWYNIFLLQKYHSVSSSTGELLKKKIITLLWCFLRRPPHFWFFYGI